MSALVDIVIGFIAALVSAALVHFGAADSSGAKSADAKSHAARPAHTETMTRSESSETAGDSHKAPSAISATTHR